MNKKEEAFFQRLVATFKIEAGEHLTKISSGLIELEKAPSHKGAEIIEAIFREAHSMKGAARVVNRSDIESFCQKLESVFAFFKNKKTNPSKAALKLFCAAIDFLGTLVESDAAPEKNEFKNLAGKLDTLLQQAEQGSAGITADATGSAVVAAGVAAESASAAGGGRRKAVAAEIVRIEKVKLDSLLLKAEEMLSVKPSAGQRCIELAGVIREVALLRKEWAVARSDFRGLMKSGETQAGSARNRRRGANFAGLTEFITAKEDFIKSLHGTLTALGKSMEKDKRSLETMLDEILAEAKNAAMSPFSSLLDLFPKIVHDLSNSQGKEVELVVRGGEIEIDRRILEEMKDPLIHLVRNCIDHGIERPEERVLKSKNRVGTITIAVSVSSGEKAVLSVSDDGAGIDSKRIRASAVKAGILPAAEADSLEEAGILPLIFQSGVTASSIITDISGRGLGLAIVQEKVEKLRGTITCESRPGSGTTFSIVLPLSLAAFPGILIRVGERLFVLPTMYVEWVSRIKVHEVKTIENRKTILHQGRTVPLLSLGELIELPQKPPKETEKEFVQTVVLVSVEKHLAVSVDEIIGEQEVMVKGLGSQLRRVRNVAGSTVLGTGKVVPILSVPDLMKSAAKVSAAAPPASRTAPEAPAVRKSILVAEDSITARALLKNILEGAGYGVHAAVDGIEAFTALRTGEFDLVVSDVDMPRMNGFDLTAKIRADRKLSELPVVLVTALEDREDRERGVDAGANAYIVKSSFDQSNLLEVISRLI